MPKVEEGPIVVLVEKLPSGEIVELPLGTACDCKTGKQINGTPPTGFPTEDVELLPIRTLKYDLHHIRDTTEKEQTLEMGLSLVLQTLIGLSITIGSVSYKSKYNSKLDVEHLQVYYYREDRVKRLLPSEAVRNKITEGWSKN